MSGYQSNQTKNKQFIAIGFGVFLLLYLASQLWSLAASSLRTEQVLDDTIYDFVRADGLVFRSEEVIPAVSGGVTVYNCSDGEEVAKGQEVAAVYRDKTVSMVNNQIDRMNQELASLQKAQTVKATRYSAVTNLSAQINEQAGKIVDTTAGGVVEGIETSREQLVSLLNRKRIALGEEDTFSQRIAQLKSEIAYLEKTKKKEQGQSIPAPAAGYFCKEVDGYETVLTAAALEDLSYESFGQLMVTEPQQVGAASGKIVTTHLWYVGVDLENAQAQKFETGDNVRLDFKFANGQTVAAKVVRIIPDGKRQNSVILFECKDVSDRLLKVRSQSVDIIFTTYSGLRVSSSALYHEQNIPGVYVLDKTTVRFKPVEIIKDNGNFLLCEPREGTDDAHTLNRLDLVILESGGIELRDGRSLDEETVKGVESNYAGS